MLIRYFRSSFVSQYVLIVLLAIAMWLPAFMRPQPAVTPDGMNPLYAVLYPLFGFSALISVVLAFLLMLFTAFLLNSILSQYQLIGRVSSMATFVFVVLMSLFPAQTMLYPLLLALPLILLATAFLFRMYESNDNELDIFNVAFLVSAASMLWFPLMSLIVWLYLALFILRITNLRSWLIPVVGLFTPYLFLATWYFMKNELIAQSKAFYQHLSTFLQFPALPTIPEMVILGLLLLIILKAYNISYSSIVDNNISIRKRKAIMNALIFSSLPLLFFKGESNMQQLLLLVPAAVFMSFSYTFIKKFVRAQIFLFALILASLINHFLVFFR